MITTSYIGKSKEHPLPRELKKFLSTERFVKTETGVFSLYSYKDIRQITILINHRNIPGEEQISENPFEQTSGYFITIAYTFVKETPNLMYPEDVLLWLPKFNSYGHYDSLNQQLYLYPKIQWEHIEKKLPIYLQVQQNLYFVNVLAYTSVWNHMDFIPESITRLASIAIRMIMMNRDLVTAEVFILKYESCLINSPFHEDLLSAYQSLLAIYSCMGHVVKNTTAEKYLNWYNKSSIVLNKLCLYLKELE